MNPNILAIPDCQVKDGVDTRHLEWLGRYIVRKRPDVIVNIGDFADMPSLSSYDVGKKSFEGRRYTKDIEAVREAMQVLLGPLRALQRQQRDNRKKVYNPRMILTLGNHENRIDRAVENDAKLAGLISTEDLWYEDDWEVFPFLQPVVINNVAFCHYFPSGAMGRPSSTANAQLNKQHMSCISGHQQGFQMATGRAGDGSLLTSVIAGSCYLHDEEYMGAFGNKHWRGALMLYDVKPSGEFQLVPVPLSFLEKKYG